MGWSRFGTCYILNLTVNKFLLDNFVKDMNRKKRQKEYLTSPFEFYFPSNDFVAKDSQETSLEG